MTHLPPSELSQLIEQSAKRGARMALAELGLDDESAPEDIRDLRHLLVNWRRIRRQAFDVALRLAVHLLLVAMLALATILLWVGGR